MVVLSKIYTRTGDDGTTGLGDGSRVAKDDPRVEAYGTVDEANCTIGMILAVPALPQAVVDCLVEVQHDLFDLGGELCIPGMTLIQSAHVDRLETALGQTAGMAEAGPVHRGRGKQSMQQQHWPALAHTVHRQSLPIERRYENGCQRIISHEGFIAADVGKVQIERIPDIMGIAFMRRTVLSA